MKTMKIRTLDRMAAHEAIKEACEYFKLNYEYVVAFVICNWLITLDGVFRLY